MSGSRFSPSRALGCGEMSAIGVIPREADFYPACSDPIKVNSAARAVQDACRRAGMSRQTYLLATVQQIEMLAGVAADGDFTPEVLAFVADRLRASADAADANARGEVPHQENTP